MMAIKHELGAVNSASWSRIIPNGTETLIAQLTVTSLDDSPVEQERVWLRVTPGASASSAGGALQAPFDATRGVR